MNLRTIYVSIGNSDDKLGQAQWAEFARLVFGAVRRVARQVFGEWYSAPNAAYQNACIAFSLHASEVLGLQADLTMLRSQHEQDALAWAEVRESVML